MTSALRIPWRGAVIALAVAVAAAGVPAAAAGTDPAAVGATIHGTVPGGGAGELTVYAWPSPATLAALDHDSTVPLVAIAHASTATDGSYTLAPDFSGLGAEYYTDAGDVSLEFDVTGAAGGTTLWYGRAGDLGAATSPAPDQVGADRSLTCLSDLGWHWYQEDYQRPERFMNAMGRPRAKVTVDQQLTSSHDLGLAVNVGDGWVGTGDIDVETHLDGGGGRTYSYSRYVYNAVNYNRYKRECFSGFGFTGSRWWQYKANPLSFGDVFTRYTAAPAPHLPYCSIKTGGTFYKTQGSGTTFHFGVSLPMVSVEAHASYSTSTTATWTFTGRVWLCYTSPEGPLVSAVTGAQYIPKEPPECRPGHPCAVRG